MKKITFYSLFIVTFAFFSCDTTEKPQGGDLTKNTWKLVEYTLGGVTYPIASNRPVTALFEETKVSGTAACNRYFGTYQTKNTELSVQEIATTKRACPNELMNVEAQFLNLLENAKNYTATLSKLTIFCTDGELSFEASHEAAIQKNSYADFLSAFAPLTLVDPHLYSLTNPENMENYPFAGKELTTYQLDYLDPETADQYRQMDTGVFQIGKYKEHYLMRTPGKYVSTDLTIFSLDKYNNRVKKEALLTFHWCDEGACNQQDAWLKDVNNDGKFDLVTKYVFTEDGKVVSTEMEVLIQQPIDGSFVKDDKITLNEADYVMEDLSRK